MLAMGRPIGTPPSSCWSSSINGSYAVVVMVASVGPYALLQRVRAPTRCCHVANASRDTFSPPTITSRSEAGSWAVEQGSSEVHADQYAVGWFRTVSLSFSNTARNSAREVDTAAGRSTTVAPLNQEGKSSSAATSKLSEANCRILSSDCKP